MKTVSKPKGWQTKRFRELFRVKHGYAFKSEHFTTSGDYILLTPGNFNDEGGFKLKGEKEKFYVGPIPRAFVLKRSDLLVAMTEQAEGLLGSSLIVPESNRFLHNQRLGLVTDIRVDAIDKHFLYYLFNSRGVRNQIRASASGVKIRHTSPERIGEVEVTIPPVPAQKKIAGILSAYDDLIENNTWRIQILEQMAQSIYREWFVHFRFPGHAQVKLIASPLGKIPQEWQPAVFTDIANILSGGTPSTRVAEYWDGDIPWFTPRDAAGSFYVTETEKHITQTGVNNCASEIYPKDTIFITARGTVGKLALAAVPMAVNQSCYAVQGKPGYGPRFVFLALCVRVDYLKKNTGGATFSTIITDTFKRMSILKPPPSLAHDFEIMVEPFFERIRLLHLQNANLRRTRDLLLPRLISGELSVENMWGNT